MKLDKEIVCMLWSYLLNDVGNPNFDVIVGAIIAGIEGRAKSVQSAIEIAFKEYNDEKQSTNKECI